MIPAVPRSDRPVWQTAALGLGVVLIAFGVAWWLTGLPGSGTDYHFAFRHLALDWLAGKTRLNDGPLGAGFYHSPWAITIIALFAVWPFRIGLTLLAGLTLLMLAAGALWFSQPGHGRPLALAFALFNFHTMDLLFRGQMSGFEVLGVGVGWLAYRRRNAWLMSIAYILLSLVPPNTIPAAIFLAWLTWRAWPRRQWIISLLPVLGVCLASFAIFGWWPPRWLWNLSAYPNPPYFLTTLWRMADQLALPAVVPWVIAAAVIAVAVWAWRRAGGRGQVDADLARLMLVIAATLMVTPYSLSYRLVPLTACVMPYLSRWRRDVLVGLYLLTFLPLARLAVGRDNSWIDLGFVAAVFIATVVCVAQYQPRAGTSQE